MQCDICITDNETIYMCFIESIISDNMFTLSTNRIGDAQGSLALRHHQYFYTSIMTIKSRIKLLTVVLPAICKYVVSVVLPSGDK